MKEKPTRKCLATNTVHPKDELFRVVKDKDNNVSLDISGRANGRGAYVFMSLEAIEKARKSKCLERALEVKIPDEIYDRMITFMNMK